MSEIICTLFNLEEIVEENQQIFTNSEACKFLRLSATTLWRERKSGKITFRRIASKIVYLREDLEAYLNQNKRNASIAK